MRMVWPNTGKAVKMMAAVAGIAGALGLSACGGDGHVDPNSVGGKLLRGTAEDVKPIDQTQFAVQPDCPRLVIRPGTQTYVIHGPGRGKEPRPILFQATISKTARDCRWASPGQVAIKVGVAGRVLAGPKGGAGDVSLPLRVVIVEPAVSDETDRVVYSQLHMIPVSVTEAMPSVPWTKIDDSIVIENKTGLKILVGFDEGAKKK